MGDSWVAPWENARNKIHADKKSPPKNSLKAAPNHKTEVLECPFFQAVEATSLATSEAVSTLAGIKLKNVCTKLLLESTKNLAPRSQRSQVQGVTLIGTTLHQNAWLSVIMKSGQCQKYLSQTDQRLTHSDYHSVLLTLASQVVLRLAHKVFVAIFAMNIFTLSAPMHNLLQVTQSQACSGGGRNALFMVTMHQNV